MTEPTGSDALAARILPLYARHAEHWDARRAADARMELAWLTRFVALLPHDAADVLDLGCGSGQPIARWLIDQGCRLTGVDGVPAMIELCRARFPDHHWQLADMRELALGRGFDGVIAWDSFFHLDHAAQRAMFARFAAHARPGAPLLFTSGPAHGEAIGEFQGEALYHASLAPEEYRQLLARHGFVVRDFRAEDPDCGRHTVWLAQRLAD